MVRGHERRAAPVIAILVPLETSGGLSAHSFAHQSRPPRRLSHFPDPRLSPAGSGLQDQEDVMPEFDFDVVSTKPEPDRLAALRRPPSDGPKKGELAPAKPAASQPLSK